MSDQVREGGAETPKAPGWAYMERWVSPAPPPNDTGGIYTVVHDGRLAVSVGLEGTLGRGRRMILDEGAWGLVSLALGTSWGIRQLDHGGLYVVGKHKASAGPGCPPTPILARWLAKAKAGQVVTYRNGDTLDLTAGNLVTVRREEFMRAWGTRST